MIRIVRVLIALAGIAALVACGAAAGSTRLSEQDAGKTVQLRAGDKLSIVLDGNPTTGYQWEQDAGDLAILKPAGEPTFNADSSALGSGGKVTVPFQAAAPGQTTLKLIYHRAFEKSVPPIKTFEVNVVVQ